MFCRPFGKVFLTFLEHWRFSRLVLDFQNDSRPEHTRKLLPSNVLQTNCGHRALRRFAPPSLVTLLSSRCTCFGSLFVSDSLTAESSNFRAFHLIWMPGVGHFSQSILHFGGAVRQMLKVPNSKDILPVCLS